ncbi:MAG: hypothetical protein SNI36_02045 [Rikenellaceae bacterium]
MGSLFFYGCGEGNDVISPPEWRRNYTSTSAFKISTRISFI